MKYEEEFKEGIKWDDQELDDGKMANVENEFVMVHKVRKIVDR